MSDINGTVVGIQGRDVDSAAPNDGDVYRWDAGTSKWVPVAPPQPLEPWQGTVNTQKQVIQRIPWVYTTTGSSWDSFLAVTVVANTAVTMSVNAAFKHPSSGDGASNQTVLLAAYTGSSWDVYSPPIVLADMQSTNFSPFTGGARFRITTSGSTASLQIAFPFAQPTTIVDCQGYVDLMVI